MTSSPFCVISSTLDGNILGLFSALVTQYNIPVSAISGIGVFSRQRELGTEIGITDFYSKRADMSSITTPRKVYFLLAAFFQAQRRQIKKPTQNTKKEPKEKAKKKKRDQKKLPKQ